uniref:Fic family protein n=1 Tax=Rathayibacter rathayi TaxID=33887 RepID=UPI000CE83168|nr:Fic family protein [Rathayibacter rathayi]PPG71816.1 cell filamentation protein Fic [Rathayibacter rathayi]PPG79125.1 cell filamentation protein Fic [Rathayibacter rathayi]PPH25374.1 cell filamentation protein Fic [Rathayibacter rathayi]PPI76877.1 cell filamentation protein Fic [Rathayibacter rathayi]
MVDFVVADLAAVVYSSGRVFDGLATGRLDTESFLRSGDLSGVTSRADLALLEDLRDASHFIIENRARPIDAGYVREINGTLTRSGSLHPGRLRRTSDRIGVSTRFGRHEPEAVDDVGLQQIVERGLAAVSRREQALDLFVTLAKAQPFMDGNKRTAIFAANSLLLRQDPPELLTVPVDEQLARGFNNLLARAYVHDEHDPVKDLLRRDGFQPVRPRSI